MRRAIIIVVVALLLPAAAAAETRVSIFYYPWYGTPKLDGAYHHWQQNGATPPHSLASAFFPSRGLYSSADPVVLRAQMREIRRARIDQIATSWWGWGSIEDLRLPSIVKAARAVGIDVAVHLEPYVGRTPESTLRDIEHLRGQGITDYYVYDPTAAPAEAWRGALDRLDGVRVFAQTSLVGFAASGGFDGVYTYDVLTHTGGKFRRLCTAARRVGLLCAPSVGPGYDARRAVGDRRIRLRRKGKTYDAMWTLALAAGADMITVTSYNEWHEGTQIEPARPWTSRNGKRYAGYEGAWGLHGKKAERAYLTRTRYWSDRFAAVAARRARLPDAGGIAG